MRVASQFPYVTPLGYHYPTPLQKDSKSDPVSSNPLRKKGMVRSDKEGLTKIKTVRDQTLFIHCIHMYLY